MYGYDVLQENGVRDPTVVLFLLHCYLQTPCRDLHGIRDAGTVSEDDKSKPPKYPTTIKGQVYEGPTKTPKYVSPETRDNLYTLARAESRYTYDFVRAPMPIARTLADTTPAALPADTMVVFDLAKPQAYRVIRVEAERVEDWPQIPQPVNYSDGPIRGILLEHWEQEQAPTLSPDGDKKIYHLEAYYKYALNRMPLVGEQYRTAVLPNTSLTGEENKIARGQHYSNKLRNGDIQIIGPVQ
jgi:hypothetical protein